MNLLNALEDMSIMTSPAAETIQAALDQDYHVLVGDRNNYDTDMIKYDLFMEDELLVIGRLSDSSSEEIVISIEMVAKRDSQTLVALWDSYLSGKDVFMIDTVGHMHEATINWGGLKLEVLKKELKPGEMIYINNPYTNPTLSFLPETKIYIEDNPAALLCGFDAVKFAAETVTNTTVVTDREKADITVLILPNTARAPGDDFFVLLEDSNKDIPVVRDTLKQKELAYNPDNPILLYWSSNVVLTGLMDPNTAQYRAASELAKLIQNIRVK